jgi:hypothetical protein
LGNESGQLAGLIAWMVNEALAKFRSAFGKNHIPPCGFCTIQPPRAGKILQSIKLPCQLQKVRMYIYI